MGFLKQIGRSNACRQALCWFVALYVRLVRHSGPWTVEGDDIPQRFQDRGQPIIVAFWHGRLLMMGYAWHRRAPFLMLISKHPDGRLIADTIARFGFGSVAGSSNEGGTVALRACLRHLKAGDCIGLTPDGPDGPAMHASAGIVALARLSQAPIVPLAYASSRRRILKSWDRFHLPLPFGRGIILWGEPIHVPPTLDHAGMDDMRALLEARLTTLTAAADSRVGRESVAPGTIARAASRRRLRRADGQR